MNAPSLSPSGKRIPRCSAKALHDGANCLSTSWSSIDLDWRTTIVVFAQQKRAVNLIRDTIIFISGHKIFTFGSCFEYESG